MKNYISTALILISTFSTYTSEPTATNLVAQAAKNSCTECMSNIKTDCINCCYNQISNDTLRCGWCPPCHHTNRTYSEILHERYNHPDKSCCDNVCFPDQGPHHLATQCAACLPCLRAFNPKFTQTKNGDISTYSLNQNNNCCQNCMFQASMCSNCLSKYTTSPVLYVATFQCCYKNMRETQETK